jgi:acetyl esterase/lipase
MLRKADMWNKPLGEIRAVMEAIPGQGIPEGVTASRMELGGVKCEVFRPARPARRAAMYFHGGGFCLGIYAANQEFVAGLCQSLSMDIYMPDYRLAPEHPFPAALDDAKAAYRALSALGYNSLLVMGDSSGCALALSTLLDARRDSTPMPKAIVMMSPVLDLSGGGDVPVSARKDPFRLTDPLGLTRNYTIGCDTRLPEISPLYGELRDLPPTLIHAAQYDVFLGDAQRFAERLVHAGVQLELKVWKRMWHTFHMQASFVPEAARAIREICSFANKMM